MAALARLIGEGFEVQADGDKLLISPAENLTDETRQWIRQHKFELLVELQSQGATNAPAELIHKIQSTPPHWSAAIASPEWLQARDAYLNHLAACPECWAPIGRYCAEGQALRLRYREAAP